MERLDARAMRTEITADRVLQEYARIAFLIELERREKALHNRSKKL